MGKRRTNAELQELDRVVNATFKTACGINNRVNPDENDPYYVHVGGRNVGGVKAEYQLELADTLVVTFDTKDAVLAERVAMAIKAEIKAYTEGKL